MEYSRSSTIWFTIFAGSCATVSVLIAVAIGSAVARATVYPHAAHGTASPEHH
jgi:hypothetical protein